MTPADARRRLGRLEADHGPRRMGLGTVRNVPPGRHYRTWRCWPSGRLRQREATRPTGWPSSTPRVDIWPTMRRHALAYARRPPGMWPRFGWQFDVCICRGWMTQPETCRSAWRQRPCRRWHSRKALKAASGECIVFADGLRFDVGKRLVAMAGARQLEVSDDWRLGVAAHSDGDGQAGSVASCRPSARREPGCRLLPRGFPTAARSSTPTAFAGCCRRPVSRCRTCRARRHYGPRTPAHGRSMASSTSSGMTFRRSWPARIEDQLELLLERVQSLLDAGWKRVRIITDHGWQLVPGGMPKVQLPKYLAESRWSRCASIKDSSHVKCHVAGWSWNPQNTSPTRPACIASWPGRSMPTAA